MDNSTVYDVAIIGGGIVGMATAMALSQETHPKLIVLEAEDHLAAHQTGHNSGVIHSGIYYKPGSSKARNCVEGRQALYRFADEHNIAHEQCGKLIVATDPKELPGLDRLYERGVANGLQGLRKLKGEEIKEFEPYASGIAGVHVQETGIIDYTQVTNAYAEVAKQNGAVVQTSTRMTGLRKMNGELVIETNQGEIRCHNLVNCAGLQCDRVAQMCGVDPGLQIIPFRGEYYELSHDRAHLVKNLIYPVPDPNFPFLGVHLTRMVHGGADAGPNAVLGFKREGYKMTDLNLRDLTQYGFYIGFWRMASKYWQTGFMEMYRSLNKAAFVKAVQRLVPELKNDDLHRSGAGVRAQALTPDGMLVDDFRIVEAEHMIHVLNAPSPAATASIAIGKSIAGMVVKNFTLA
jgi:L-2-hydroxyglutarate oxidase